MKIYNANGTLILDVVPDDDSYRYRAIMGDNALTLKYELAEHVEIPVGAYCDFQNERYFLMRPEAFKMNHTRSFEYTVTMQTYQQDAKKWKFRNTVDGRLKFSLTATPREHLQMFVDNMNRRGSGWTLDADNIIESTEHTISYDHAYCWDALNQMAQEFDTEFEIKGKKVSLRKVEYNKDAEQPLALSYGRGNGFKTGVARANYSETPPVEYLFAQGGSTNIDRSKYGQSELHLPKVSSIRFDGTHFEDEDGFVEANAHTYATDDDGLSVFCLDKDHTTGTEDSLDCSDIYPKFTCAVSKVYVITSKSNAYYELTDENKSRFTEDDLGTISLYDVVCDGIPDSLDYSACQIDGETMTVTFQSGNLAGKEFEVNYIHEAKKVNGVQKPGKRFELVQQEIDGVTMPCEGFAPEVQDTFVVFNVMLPDAYINAYTGDDPKKSGAEWDMLRECVKYLHEHEEETFTFTGTLDGIWAKQDWENIGGKILLGGYVKFSDDRFQKNGVLIRITGIKDYINNPHSPELELSNETITAGVGTTLQTLASQEVVVEENYKSAVQYTKRRFRDAKETMSMLEAAMLEGFTDRISPIAIQTMQMLVGDESLQFRFINAISTSPKEVDCPIEYDATTKQLTYGTGTAYIQHLSLGIDSLSSEHQTSEYMFWKISGDTKSATLDDSTKSYYIYAKVTKTLPNSMGNLNYGTGVFTISETSKAMESEDSYYYLLVGILNSEYDGTRSLVMLYGFTEVLPGRITTDRVVSGDGESYFDMKNDAMKLGDKLSYKDGKLLLKGTMVQSTGEEAESPLGCYRGEYNDSYSYYVGDTVTYAISGKYSLYRCIKDCTGIAPTNSLYWTIQASAGTDGTTGDKGEKGDSGADGSSYSANLLLESNTKELGLVYGGRAYPVEDMDSLVVGEDYTITIWGDLGGKTSFFLDSADGMAVLADKISTPGNGVYSKTFTLTQAMLDGIKTEKSNNSVKIYTHPGSWESDDYTSTSFDIYKVKLERGKNSSPVWTPAASEMIGTAGTNGVGSCVIYSRRLTVPDTPKAGTILIPDGWSNTPDMESFDITYDEAWTVDDDGYRVSPAIGDSEATVSTLKFTTTKPYQRIAIAVAVSSRIGDYLHIGKLDTDVSRSSYAASYYGTDKTGVCYVDIPTAGEHYLQIEYSKDSAYSAGDDCGKYRVIEVTNCWICFGTIGTTGRVESWTVPQPFITDNDSEERVYLLMPSKKAPNAPVSNPYVDDYIPALNVDDYDADTTYNTNDLARGANGKVYICIKDGATVPPVTATTSTSGVTTYSINVGYWAVFSCKWTDNPSGLNSTYSYQFESIRKKQNGVWGDFSTPVLWNYLAKDGAAGNFTEYRYRIGGSSTTAPALLNKTRRSPANWETAQPKLTSIAEYLWRISAVIDGATDALVDGEWSDPVLVSGVRGDSGPAMTYRGEWSEEKVYTGTTSCIECVHYTDGAYYFTQVTAGSIPKGTLPTDTNYWNPFGASFESVATGLLLAEFAYIDNLGVRSLRTNANSTTDYLLIDEKNNSMTVLDSDGASVEVAGGTMTDGAVFTETTVALIKPGNSGSIPETSVLMSNSNGYSDKTLFGVTAKASSELAGEITISLTGQYTVGTVPDPTPISQNASLTLIILLDGKEELGSVSMTPFTTSQTVSSKITISKTIAAGTHTLVARVKYATPYLGDGGSLTFSGKVMSTDGVTATSKIHLSRYLTNGYAVGCGATQYTEALMIDEKMLYKTEAGNAGISLNDGVMKLKLGGEWYTVTANTTLNTLSLSKDS
jgi:hypothetical protein